MSPNESTKTTTSCRTTSWKTLEHTKKDTPSLMLGAGALGRPRGMVWRRRREEGSGWGTRVYLWQIHVDIWQSQYNSLKLKNKIKRKDTPSLKTKEKPQWDGRIGIIMIKWNPILDEWPTNWKRIIPKEFFHCSEGSEPYVSLPSLGIHQRD